VTAIVSRKATTVPRTEAESDAKWAVKDAKRHDEERQRKEHLEAERARRGDPQRFTLTGLHMRGTGRDCVGILPSIDPDLEMDEVIEVVELAALRDCERERDHARDNVRDAEGWYANIVGLLRPFKAELESWPSPSAIIPRLIERMETAEARVVELEEWADGRD